MITYTKRPSDCSFHEIDVFRGMLARGNEVITIGLDRRIESALGLVFQHNTGRLVGIGALKVPCIGYKNRIFNQAQSLEKPDDFLLELG